VLAVSELASQTPCCGCYSCWQADRVAAVELALLRYRPWNPKVPRSWSGGCYRICCLLEAG
jgi:hypothetical protein